METGVRMMKLPIGPDGSDFMKQIGRNADVQLSARQSGSETRQSTASAFARSMDRAKSADRSASQPVVQKRAAETRRPETAKVREDDRSAGTQDAQTVQNSDAQKADQARNIIRASLKAVSEKLGIKVADEDVLSNIDLENPTEEVCEQLAEILAALKGMAGVLDDAAAQGVALDVNGREIMPVDAQDMEKTLRVESFRLEVAFSMVGVAGEVNKLAAEKLGAPIQSGLAVAVDPASIDMPKSQIDQLFSNLIEVGEEKIRAVMSKMNELANSASQSAEKTLGGSTVQSALVASVHQEIVVTGLKTSRDETSGDQAMLRDLKTAGSGTMRILAKGEGESRPVEAASGKDDADTASLLSLKSERFAQVSQKAAQGLVPMTFAEAVSQLKQKDDTVSPLQAQVKQQVELLSIDSAKPAHRIAGPDAAVMQQLTEKLSHAVRTGSTEIRMHLRPESLGEVKMSIRVENDVVTARILVENQQVKQIVENNLQNLRDSLTEHNLTVGSFSVDVGTQGQNRADDFAAGQGHDERRGNNGSESSSGTAVESGTAHAPVGRGEDTGRRYGGNSMEMYI